MPPSSVQMSSTIPSSSSSSSSTTVSTARDRSSWKKPLLVALLAVSVYGGYKLLRYYLRRREEKRLAATPFQTLFLEYRKRMWSQVRNRPQFPSTPIATTPLRIESYQQQFREHVPQMPDDIIHLVLEYLPHPVLLLSCLTPDKPPEGEPEQLHPDAPQHYLTLTGLFDPISTPSLTKEEFDQALQLNSTILSTGGFSSLSQSIPLSEHSKFKVLPHSVEVNVSAILFFHQQKVANSKEGVLTSPRLLRLHSLRTMNNRQVHSVSMISSSEWGELTCWDLYNNKIVYTLRERRKKQTTADQIALHPFDAQIVATCHSVSGEISVWSIATGQELFVIRDWCSQPEVTVLSFNFFKKGGVAYLYAGALIINAQNLLQPVQCAVYRISLEYKYAGVDDDPHPFPSSVCFDADPMVLLSLATQFLMPYDFYVVPHTDDDDLLLASYVPLEYYLYHDELMDVVTRVVYQSDTYPVAGFRTHEIHRIGWVEQSTSRDSGSDDGPKHQGESQMLFFGQFSYRSMFVPLSEGRLGCLEFDEIHFTIFDATKVGATPLQRIVLYTDQLQPYYEPTYYAPNDWIVSIPMCYEQDPNLPHQFMMQIHESRTGNWLGSLVTPWDAAQPDQFIELSLPFAHKLQHLVPVQTRLLNVTDTLFSLIPREIRYLDEASIDQSQSFPVRFIQPGSTGSVSVIEYRSNIIVNCNDTLTRKDNDNLTTYDVMWSPLTDRPEYPEEQGYMKISCVRITERSIKTGKQKRIPDPDMEFIVDGNMQFVVPYDCEGYVKKALQAQLLQNDENLTPEQIQTLDEWFSMEAAQHLQTFLPETLKLLWNLCYAHWMRLNRHSVKCEERRVNGEACYWIQSNHDYRFSPERLKYYTDVMRQTEEAESHLADRIGNTNPAYKMLDEMMNIDDISMSNTVTGLLSADGTKLHYSDLYEDTNLTISLSSLHNFQRREIATSRMIFEWPGTPKDVIQTFCDEYLKKCDKHYADLLAQFDIDASVSS